MEQSLPFIIFCGLSVLLIGLSLVVVTARSAFRSAIALTAALGVVAGLFAMLGADFVAAGQLLIYVGGIMIIMLFVIMLSQRPADQIDRQSNDQWLWGAFFAVAISSALIIQLRTAFRGIVTTTEALPATAAIGRLLLGDMVVPFEAVSLVLLAALLGAIHFGKTKDAA